MSAGADTTVMPIHLMSGSDIARHHWDEITRLELEENVAELEAKGLTVIPPDKVKAPDLAARLLEAMLRVAEQRTGGRPDVLRATEPGRGAFGEAFGLQLYYLLFEDKAFQEAIEDRRHGRGDYVVSQGGNVLEVAFQVH